MLPHIPPNIQLVKGKIIDVGAKNTDYFDWSSTTFEKAALEMVPNISQRYGPPVGLLDDYNAALLFSQSFSQTPVFSGLALPS